MELDALTLFTALVAIFLGVVVPRLLRRRAAPPAPRGDGVVVLECVELEAPSRRGAAKAAATRWVACHANFGAQLKALRGVSARRDASFCAVIVVEPLRNFEDGGLVGTLQYELVDNYLRSLGRAAAGLAPVFAVVADRELLKLTTGGLFARPVLEPLGAEDAIPAPAAAVVEALRRPRSFWDEAKAAPAEEAVTQESYWGNTGGLCGFQPGRSRGDRRSPEATAMRGDRRGGGSEASRRRPPALGASLARGRRAAGGGASAALGGGRRRRAADGGASAAAAPPRRRRAGVRGAVAWDTASVASAAAAGRRGRRAGAAGSKDSAEAAEAAARRGAAASPPGTNCQVDGQASRLSFLRLPPWPAAWACALWKQRAQWQCEHRRRPCASRWGQSGHW